MVSFMRLVITAFAVLAFALLGGGSTVGTSAAQADVRPVAKTTTTGAAAACGPVLKGKSRKARHARQCRRAVCAQLTQRAHKVSSPVRKARIARIKKRVPCGKPAAVVAPAVTAPTATPSATPTVDPVVTPESEAPAVVAPVVDSGAAVKPDSQPAASTPVVPGPTNTGVPAGTKLTVYNGDMVITTAGTVVNGLDIRGTIQVKAPNVTIKNTIIRFVPGGKNIGIWSLSTGLQVTDVEIAPTSPTAADNYNGVMGSGFTLTRVNIHKVVDSVHVSSTNPVLIQNSWFHDNTHWLNDPAWNGGPSHDDNIQLVIGKDVRIVNNSIYGAFNAAIQVSQDKGAVTGLYASGNTFGGGGCTVNIAAKSYAPVVASIVNNKFMRNQRLKGCVITRGKLDQITATGNTWADTGAVAVMT